ncbi:RNA polymerase sigma factor [Bacillus horti]|uniref:RNA polymerase sigma-70 factor (ECF subfamily) n=1 Tax=Caldalkalibacillus horti TaxID=77523 RepID=A0ABT9W515_9BACI|nr:RNA polymerase sigma factor [Bacillus horti]MDQ0168167.1 RNA polymerase sigma-70 factor (ECF subfamily) [Bacillus horti]
MATHSDDILQVLPILKRYCHAIAPSIWEADDLVQDTFIRWYTFQKNTKSTPKLSKAFLYQMAIHTWIDQKRKQRHQEQQLVDSNKASSFEDRFDVEHTLEQLVQQLTLKQSVTFFLHDVFDYKAKEISFLLKTSEGAIKAALHRARNALKRYAEEQPITRSTMDETPFEMHAQMPLSEQETELVKVMSHAIITQDPQALLRYIPVLGLTTSSTVQARSTAHTSQAKSTVQTKIVGKMLTRQPIKSSLRIQSQAA